MARAFLLNISDKWKILELLYATAHTCLVLRTTITK